MVCRVTNHFEISGGNNSFEVRTEQRKRGKAIYRNRAIIVNMECGMVNKRSQDWQNKTMGTLSRKMDRKGSMRRISQHKLVEHRSFTQLCVESGLAAALPCHNVGRMELP